MDKWEEGEIIEHDNDDSCIVARGFENVAGALVELTKREDEQQKKDVEGTTSTGKEETNFMKRFSMRELPMEGMRLLEKIEAEAASSSSSSMPVVCQGSSSSGFGNVNGKRAEKIKRAFGRFMEGYANTNANANTGVVPGSSSRPFTTTRWQDNALFPGRDMREIKKEALERMKQKRRGELPSSLGGFSDEVRKEWAEEIKESKPGRKVVVAEGKARYETDEEVEMRADWWRMRKECYGMGGCWYCDLQKIEGEEFVVRRKY
ncbi:hypothetical protein QBC43DRAFT_285317 [Cladorrhinum sp. PSN259]|nr:hypothetical protein QBC43DRAFT_285317 [Cladorrhinum sp. PSN259]